MPSSGKRKCIGHTQLNLSNQLRWLLIYYGCNNILKKIVLLNIVNFAHCSSQETTATWPAWRMGCGPFQRPCVSWCVEHPPSSLMQISRLLVAEKISTKWARFASTSANQVTMSLDPPEKRESTWKSNALQSAWFRKPGVKLLLGKGWAAYNRLYAL